MISEADFDKYNIIDDDSDGTMCEVPAFDAGVSLKARLLKAGIITQAQSDVINFSSEVLGLDKAEAERIIRHVWTVTESDDDNSLVASPGWRFVNRLGIIVTEKPWASEDDDAYFYESIDDDDELDLDEDEDDDDNDNTQDNSGAPRP